MKDFMSPAHHRFFCENVVRGIFVFQRTSTRLHFEISVCVWNLCLVCGCCVCMCGFRVWCVCVGILCFWQIAHQSSSTKKWALKAVQPKARMHEPAECKQSLQCGACTMRDYPSQSRQVVDDAPLLSSSKRPKVGTQSFDASERL